MLFINGYGIADQSHNPNTLLIRAPDSKAPAQTMMAKGWPNLFNPPCLMQCL
jgi:hypothetical protein